MIWNTEKINNIFELLESGSSIKQIIRDININHILSDETEKIKFPFLISPKEGLPVFRTPFLSFEYTEEEIQNLFELKSDASSILKYFDFPDDGYQKKWIDSYQQKKYNFFVKSRQIGETTLSLICAIHYILTNTEKSVYFLCRDQHDVIDKFDKFIRLYENNIPFYLKRGVTNIKENKKHSIEFDNLCSINFIKSGDNILKGNYHNFLIIEDFSLMSESKGNFSIANYERGLISSLPTSDTNNLVYKVCNSTTLYNIQYFDWTSVKSRDENWLKQTIISLGSMNFFKNEYCCGRLTPEIQSYLRDFKINSLL